MGAGRGYYYSKEQLAEYERRAKEEADKQAIVVAKHRHELAAKIVMAVVDKIVAEIIRPGPKPEERECYAVAGELRELTPELERLAKSIIDVNDGVD